MSLPLILFVLVATATCVSAVGVVASRNVVRMAVWLLFTLIGIALVYFLLGAEFAGAAQLIVYVGGTLVLVVFGVMLTAHGPLRELRTRRVEWIVGGTLGAVLFALLAVVSLKIGTPPPGDDALPGVGQLGLSFLGVTETSPKGQVSGVATGSPPAAYLLPFEIVSVHLLVVLVGAAYLARAKRKRVKQ
ncbi:nadh-ubiquinone plastoquinone oxidoreductase chain 6 : NADH-ubiquinone/plastoquinone oxidoreductase chain 6 OS=Planctomyces limnophilus (strain ATCC 43296 / DSM 3776 / IFAM 1008 / 290) GN=Plim_0267 PE=3 SV=1: Oxidored_q3 [Gemmata massiliana]|uniref:NADH-quinone oxidoreductase subunit J n=1 Tax=Gemmata massiliana TaxID=1210884 RepID=A0A6P2D607_9BACT|nr:NADH-quinone oxidoreductase subunit J [Gemmata massiliana]VTR95885.1 nadh-ubiquinone plastoquinone oxidoreductase chain 6 : NADH-ubiquinone/plastoquinone oxidoreductase chain 6 OS=Planctomyces limnophilus (strain ATCC 43296 / DSM 3776 / IFAM 1008 / 290) GN=Plim_0267 PE=3 SV=1: Oxidored_q3 [Gemmata massiliana]